MDTRTNPTTRRTRQFSVVLGILLLSFNHILGTPISNLDTTKVYMPDELNELRRTIAYQECLRDPSCDPNFFSGIPDGMCSIGAGVETMLSDIVDTRSSNPGVRRCNPFLGEILWHATGDCVTLLTQGHCPVGFWVKLQIPSLQPECEIRPCNNGQALMEGKCMDMRDTSMCPPGQVLTSNEFGGGECDCAPGTVYHALTNTCYSPYSQGPCPPGQIIKVLDDPGVGKAECMPNPCPAENMVKINQQCQVQDISESASGTCYLLDTKGPCTSGTLTIDRVLLEPVCLLQTENHSIFNLPNIGGCPRGSIRDRRGRCRRDLSKTFGRPRPLVTSRPGAHANGSLCPKDQVFLGGVCYRLSFKRPRPSS